MEVLIDNSKILSPNGNNGTASVSNERVQQLSDSDLIAMRVKGLMRCLNIVRNLERLEPENAFDEVCKLLFICTLLEKKDLEQIMQKSDEYELQDFFSRAKKFDTYNIYEKLDAINLSVKTYPSVLTELDYLDWANIALNERGQIFDNFFINVSKNVYGLISTPSTIVNYMVDILDPQIGEKICDPCCGIGSFLLKSSQHLKTGNTEYIYGVDNNEKTVKYAKMRLLLYQAKGITVYKDNGLLDTHEIIKNKFDVVFATPPFGVRIEKNGEIEQEYNEKYREYTLRHKRIETMFIERCLNLLKPGGRMGIVLGEGVFAIEAFAQIRNYIESKAQILNITSLPTGAFLPFSSIKTTIIFLRKFAENEYKPKDYKVSFADIEEVGVSLRNKPTPNQLILLAKEYKNSQNNPTIGNQTLLKKTNKNLMKNWSVGYLTNIDIKRNEKFDYVKLSALLFKNNSAITIDNEEEYQRVTVRYNNAVILRDKKFGSNIGTKRQFRISKGQLIVSKFGANSGAIGIVPNELDNAIVTSDFLTFDIDHNKILPEYLVLILSLSEFKSYFSELTTGSVMKRLNESLFLNTEIPLPSKGEQTRFVEKIIDLKNKIKESHKELEKELNLFKTNLLES